MGQIKEFDVNTVDLEGKNLIEASAGTGKTYSVALLVLRLMIEKEMPVEKILMVTFTKPATAELESRIRKFVRQALKYSSGEGNAEQKIMEIVDAAGMEKCKMLLKKAVQGLDQLSVMTIHSFCEHCLMQYPFETGQPFKLSIEPDISALRDMVVNDYWRKKITILDNDLFRHFKKKLTRDSLRDVLKKAMDGKDYICAEINETEVLGSIEDQLVKVSSAYKNFEEHVFTNYNAIKSKNLKGFARKFLDKCDSPSEFIDGYVEGYNKKTQYIEDCFPKEYELYSIFETTNNILEELTSSYIFNIFRHAIEDLKIKVTDYKKEKGIIDFNDQIALLHKAVKTGLVNNVLAKKYDAVFIDEFQDTDKFQYEIFSTIFTGKTIFYIGDPKQSIFGWRKADIDTYKKAKEEADAIYSMDLNFRSTKELIKALNDFFSIENPFADDKIRYSPVNMGRSDLGSMTFKGEPVDPFEIYGFNNKDEIADFTISRVRSLIKNPDILINGKSVKPSDIAIIVRSNREGKRIKNALSEANIPAVTIDDAKVMSTDEARTVRFLLDAVISPSRGKINRVLLNPAFGIDSRMIRNLDEEKHLDNFLELKKILNDTGIYNMMLRFFDLYQLRHFGLRLGIGGQRTITNLYHIAEILHEEWLKHKYTPAELLNWCRCAENTSNADFEQRIESQDEAVQVTTIHRSKGLTYKIVLAPYLDLKVDEFPIFEFREDGEYKFTHEPSGEQKELWRTQIEQENRRLIYVALTRAQYKVYVCINNSGKCRDTSIKQFPVTNQKQQSDDESIPVDNTRDVKSLNSFSPRETPDIIIKNTFSTQSFSALSKAHHSSPFEKAELGGPEGYDQFIFQDLARGASTGTALHSIFERLEFNNPDTWMTTITDASKFWKNIIKEERLDHFHQLASHVMNSQIGINGETFRLSEVNNNEKLPELEFLFSVNSVNRAVLNEYLGDDAKLGGETDIEGLMTGFMDLVFRHNGKYYILDWKSNHLGNTIDCYNREGMEEAMKGSNYHLQYLIYTVAMKRWLESKGIDFHSSFGGVIYVFLRGVREGSETGIYTATPDKTLIERIDAAMSN